MTTPKRRIGDLVSGPTTFVAAATKIVGKIVGQGPYVFCGTVEGDCDIDGTVTLAAGGLWKGSLRATDVVVAGTVDGDVIARRKVEVGTTGKVLGRLEGDSVAIARGAVIEGEVLVRSGREPTTFEEKRKR
ncbi:MAG: polymer-forming cytoskeletal protein [Gammaproteobacteria bacterium]|nr:hypothetical protein [Gammaproteobacteria bacterium]